MNRAPLLLLSLLGFIMLTACDAVRLNPLAARLPETPPPATQITSAEPADVLREFIAAWNREDYDGMYRLIASRSRELYPRQTFANRYQAVHSIIRVGAVDHRLNQVEYQGTTAVLDYDLVMESPDFGAIEDTRRTLRMIQEGGWKIAWSPMDIFDGLSSQARLEVSRKFLPRANIYDRHNQLLAEENGRVASLYVVQQDMNDIDDCIDTLAKVTRQQVNTLRSIFASYYTETRFHAAEIDPERYLEFREALEGDCAISSQETALSKVLQYRTRRYYGHGIASHLVGYIGHVPSDRLELWESRGYAGTDLVGITGIENAYEETLAGRPQRFLQIIESGRTVIRQLGSTIGKAPSPVTLTIDRDLQDITAQALSDAVNYALPNWGGVALGGAVVAMDVNTGAILALASYPSFDPHIFNPDTYYNVGSVFQRITRDSRSPLQNKALAEQYAPGSVYKIVTLLAAASEDIWDAAERFPCELEWYGRERFNDAPPFRTDWRIINGLGAAGHITMTEALASSCNPFFWEMGAEMFQRDSNLQTDYAQLLGFGRPTGLTGLGPEAAGDLGMILDPDPENTDSATQAINNAIGQGNVAVTVLQMAQATALIANGGKLYQPYVVSHTGTAGDSDYQPSQPTLLRDLELDADALDIVRQGMCAAVTTELGTARDAFKDRPYSQSLCGKTGTAQTALYPNAWFIAYHPADEPQIALAGVMANSREGSEVVAPIIRRILDNYLGYDPAPLPSWWRGPYTTLEIQAEAFANSQEG